ncbi:tail fiber domain-containing protein [Klebsiella variicola subsp. variicola]|uniref:tail fiber domain-containing protein n=1 Tax=Klebsiella variicola TaxID=244366 RepID=UPI002FE30ABE
MSNIFTGNEFKLSLNLDPNNRVPQGAGIHEIPYISSMPTLEVSSSVQSYETYGSGYEEYLLDNMSVSPMDITVSYVPDNEIHMQLEDLVSSRAEFQLILQYLIEDDRISYAIVNGKLSSKSTSGSKDSVVSKTYQFKPTNLIAQYSTMDALDALYVGNYGVGSNGNDVPQYETDAPTGNAFIKVPSNLQNNPTGTDLMGVGFIDGDSTAAIAMTKSGTLSLFARNQTTAWTRIYTATQMDGRYVPLTRTINGYPLSANVTLTKSDVGLGNVTNDAQLKIASNLSDLSDKAVARTNLDVYSKGEVDSTIATLNTNISNVYTKTETDAKISTVQTQVTKNTSDIANVYTKAESDAKYVPKTTTVNGKALSGNITLTKSDVGLSNVTNDAQLKIASNLSDLNNPVTARDNLGLTALGIGGTPTVLSSMDWLTQSFVVGGLYVVAAGGMTNTPAALVFDDVTTITMIRVVATDGTFLTCEVWPSTSTESKFRMYNIRFPSGTTSTRTFWVRRIWDSSSTIPLANGGTGATTAAAARTNLGLGTAAVLNTGTTAGQVMLTGSFGIGSNTASSINDITSNVDMMTRLKAIGGTVWRGATASGTTVTDGLYSHGSGIFLTAGDTMSAINIDYATGKVKVYAANNTALNAGTIQYNSLYGTANKPSLAGDVTGTLPLANGGTGATTAAAARTSLGLGSSAVYNIGTSGANIPLLNTANTFSGNQGIQGNLSISNTGESRITLGTSVIRDNGNKSLVISSSSGTSGGVFIRPISDTDSSVQINGTNLGWTINGAVKLISSASFQSGLVIPFTNGDVTLRAINSTEGSGTGVVFDASNSTENSFGIVNTGGGSAVFHNYTKPSDSSAVATGVLIGGYGSRPWTGSTYTEHSNVSQHFLMDGTASATNHGGWFRLLTTPLNSTMDDRRQTFATSNNGDLYCGYDVPMGTYKLSANGLSDLNGRGIKQINNTANEVALITPANGAGSSSNIRATGFGGTFNAPTNTQTGHDMWIGLSGYNGSFTNTRGGLRTTAWANWTSTSTPVGLEVHTTPNNSTSRVAVWEFNPSGNLLPRTDNAYSLGIAGYRVSVVYAGSGTINTSDARLKTEVREFTGDEIAAAQALAKEIGFYKWNDSVVEKGEDAREHCGMTVQKAMEIMESCNLDPFNYGFICYDKWEEEVRVNEYDENDNPIETIVPAGDRYSFRIEQLNLFISRGQQEKLDSLEARLKALESK